MQKIQISDIVYFFYKKNAHLIMILDFNKKFMIGIDLHVLFKYSVEFTIHFYNEMKKILGEEIVMDESKFFEEIILKYPIFDMSNIEKMTKKDYQSKFLSFMTVLNKSLRKFDLYQIESDVIIVDFQKALKDNK
jgi:hypothetical protein